jgi:hypothetical protein
MSACSVTLRRTHFAQGSSLLSLQLHRNAPSPEHQILLERVRMTVRFGPLSPAPSKHGSQLQASQDNSTPPRRKSMRLRRNQNCPIHRSFSCCGREAAPKARPARQLGVRRVEDPHHPRGYRELRSNAEMRKLLDRKIASQGCKCALCGADFTDYGDVVPDHISPRGMGGAWRDDHPDNIQAVHWWCNGEKGSRRI